MKREYSMFFAASLLLVLAAGAAIYWLVGRQNQPAASPTQPGYAIGFGSDTVRAKVLDIMEEGTIDLGGTVQPYQIALVKLLEGPHSGQLTEIDFGRRQIRPTGRGLVVGEQVLVTTSLTPDGTLTAYFTDFVREKPILVLFVIFIILSVVVSGWKGVRSIFSMGISLLVIIGWIIPQILKGEDPILTSILGSAFLMAVTIYLTYGWALKTHAAVLGTLMALTLTGFLADFFIDFTYLTGFSNEDALFLSQLTDVKINLRGLVLGGMLIGALGVLDDLVVTQASAVFELYNAGQHEFRTLYQRAMRIGRDHVAATINTLVLAYAGAALPMLLLFSLSGEQISYLVNLEFVAEEIVRTIVGSLGLISSVPLTTGLACLLATNHDRLSFLGQLDTTVAGSHSHTHEGH